MCIDWDGETSIRLFSLALIAGLGVATASGAVTFSTTELTGGTAVDLSGLTPSTNSSTNAIASNDAAFTAAGISSLTASGPTFREFHDSGPTFGAGPALFNAAGDALVLINEGVTRFFGNATFTIEFASLVDGFGVVLADTSNNFINPRFEVFRGGASIFDQVFSDP